MNSNSLNKVLFALNLVLVAIIIMLLVRQPKTQPPQVVAPNQTTAALSATIARPYANLGTDADWRRWTDTLRDAGVPTRVLARLAREGFEDRWQKRQSEAQAAYMRGEVDPDGLAALSVEHDMEQEKAIHAALGDEDFRKWDLQNVLQSINLRDIQLTAPETNALYELEKNHRQHLNELLASKLKGKIDQATLNEQQTKAQADHDAQLKSLLGAQRYATLQGVDDSAGNLQRGLSQVALPANVPFESLLGIQNKWIERRSEMEGRILETTSQTLNYEQELKRMDDAREQEFQRVLGTNAFDALEKGQDTRYKEMKRYADTWGLDATSTDYLYKTIKYYEKSAEDYRSQATALEAQGQTVDWDAITKNLHQFSQQTEQVVRNYLGDDRFSIIKSNGIFPFAPAK